MNKEKKALFSIKILMLCALIMTIFTISYSGPTGIIGVALSYILILSGPIGSLLYNYILGDEIVFFYAITLLSPFLWLVVFMQNNLSHYLLAVPIFIWTFFGTWGVVLMFMHGT